MAEGAQPILIIDEDGHICGLVLDGSVYRLPGAFKVQDTGGNFITPSKDSTLVAIKDTDGIKKIVDALPAGTNTLGKVDQGTAGATAWKTDGSGVTQPISATALPLPTGAATETTLALIKNTDGIKKIVDALPTGSNEIGKVAQGTKAAGSAAWPTVLYDSIGNAVGVVLDGSVYRLQTQTKIARASDGNLINPATEDTLALIKNTDGIKKITDSLPAGDNLIGRAKLTDGTNVLVVEAGGQGRVLPYAPDRAGVTRTLNLVQDELESTLYRLAVTGKVSITVPPPPPGGTKVTITADTPLEISQAISPYLTEWTIPDGKTLFIQQIVAGCQGDPSADGSKVEVYYYDGTTNHIVDRVYVVGQTAFGNYPDTNQARDGTVFTGVGTARKIRVYRSRLSNSLQEIDAVIRGYTI